MDPDGQYDDQPIDPYWAGIYVPKIETIVSKPVSEEDLRRLDMWEHVDTLPLTSAAYRTLPEADSDRVSTDDDIALQPYHEFLTQYEEHTDTLTPAVHKLLPDHVLRNQLDANPSTVARYLTEDGRRLIAETGTELPEQNGWDEYVDQEAFADEATVLYAQTRDAVEQADLGWALINLKLAEANQHLREWGLKVAETNQHLNGWRDGMGDIADNMDEIRDHTKGVRDNLASQGQTAGGFRGLAEGQERMIEQLEQIAGYFEELEESSFR